MNEERYRLVCIAPDGEYVVEGKFQAIGDAWNRNDDMGSRWIFYPIRVVTTSGTGKYIRDAAGYAATWRGRRLASLCGEIARMAADGRIFPCE